MIVLFPLTIPIETCTLTRPCSSQVNFFAGWTDDHRRICTPGIGGAAYSAADGYGVLAGNALTRFSYDAPALPHVRCSACGQTFMTDCENQVL